MRVDGHAIDRDERSTPLIVPLRASPRHGVELSAVTRAPALRGPDVPAESPGLRRCGEHRRRCSWIRPSSRVSSPGSAFRGYRATRRAPIELFQRVVVRPRPPRGSRRPRPSQRDTRHGGTRTSSTPVPISGCRHSKPPAGRCALASMSHATLTRAACKRARCPCRPRRFDPGMRIATVDILVVPGRERARSGL